MYSETGSESVGGAVWSTHEVLLSLLSRFMLIDYYPILSSSTTATDDQADHGGSSPTAAFRSHARTLLPHGGGPFQGTAGRPLLGDLGHLQSHCQRGRGQGNSTQDGSHPLLVIGGWSTLLSRGVVIGKVWHPTAGSATTQSTKGGAQKGTQRRREKVLKTLKKA